MAADPLPTWTATSAYLTCLARASASLCTATVSRPNARALFITLQAISPLLATRRRLRLVRAIFHASQGACWRSLGAVCGSLRRLVPCAAFRSVFQWLDLKLLSGACALSGLEEA